jgi:Reverse transcriptase (RNA-dependent DNA polymerase)
LTSLVDAAECRDVATVDIPGAFMQADMDEDVHMQLDGKMAELLAQVESKIYCKFVLNDRGKEALYVKLKKALYRTMRAGLLFWRKLTHKTKKMGIKINPYNECVANKIIDESACTIVWHVDDLKISHREAKIISEIISQLKAIFGKEAPLTINRGKGHDNLGMTIDFSIPCKVTIKMDQYINDIIDSLTNDMKDTASTPAANHLFEVNSVNPTYLPENEAIKFHHLVAKLLFFCKRVRPNIHTAVAFLCTRVKHPDYDDYKKLARVIKYLQTTDKLELTLEAHNIGNIQWWVDALYAIHPDMRGHTGGIFTLGKGAIYTTSIRQKLTTRSSTEGELVCTM